MKVSKLTGLNFMALCCILGLFTKKLINPFANIITEVLHIPGGVSTGFSIMFLVIAKEIVGGKSSGTLMATVQGLLALALGRLGSMGILMPIAYIATGIAIDFIYYIAKYIKFTQIERMVFANAFAAFMASLIANILVFQLPMSVMGLYYVVSLLSGTCFGMLGSYLAVRLNIALNISKGV